MQYIGQPLSDEKALKNFQTVLQLSQQSKPRSLYRVIEVTSDQGSEELAGFVRLKRMASGNTALIGVMLRAKFEGQGLAFQAQQSVMEEVWDKGFCRSFTAYCHINNERANRLYQRLGFNHVQQLIYNHQPSIQWQRGF